MHTNDKMDQEDCLSLGNNNNNNVDNRSSSFNTQVGGDVEQHYANSSKDLQRANISTQFGEKTKAVKVSLNTSSKLEKRKMKTILRKNENHRQLEMSFPKDSLNRPVFFTSNLNKRDGGSNPISKDDGGITGDNNLLPNSTNWSMDEGRSFSSLRPLTEDTRSKNLSKEPPCGTCKQGENNIDSDTTMAKRTEEYVGFTGTTTSTVSSSSSSFHNHHLARVDPIVDFFTVDEELLGRFRICSYLSRHIRRSSSCSESGGSISSTYGDESDGGTQQQQAIIFKIKTTSPYSFWVRPIYGLMRPNVIAWVEVKCELKANNNSLAKLVQNMDEFLVEICPVPGAINTMTSDLYTSAVHSNLPELWSIWEKVEQELTENQQQRKGFVKEFHRVSCRFQRSSLSSSLQSLIESSNPTLSSSSPVSSLQPSSSVFPCLKNETRKNDTQMPQEGETNNNNDNNVKIFQWNSASTSITTTTAPIKTLSRPLHQDHYPKSEECFHLAREFPYSEREFVKDEQWEDGKEEDNVSGEKTTRPSRRAYLKAIKKLWCLAFILASLLFVALIVLLYTQFYHHYYISSGDVDDDDGSNNDSKKNLQQTDETTHYFHDNKSISVVSNTSSNKGYVYR